ncbi:hypothetical protein HPB49_023090 [Dermacentor silvarum]|uniref:Uncharacterized protein n=1 Tax=Dermacentor silvarum TaxID=543639 RepID=A0ACB8E475_DERSI|nr:hypothetical protein HPB49_023090 [Dermacentor silvarum]
MRRLSVDASAQRGKPTFEQNETNCVRQKAAPRQAGLEGCGDRSTRSAGGAICARCRQGAYLRVAACSSGSASTRVRAGTQRRQHVARTWRPRAAIGPRPSPAPRRPPGAGGGALPSPVGGTPVSPPGRGGLQRGQSYGRRLLRAACVLTKADPRRFGGVKSAGPGALSGGALPRAMAARGS